MAYEISNTAVKITLVAGADLSAHQYKFVKMDASGNAVIVAALTDRPIGVLQNAPLSGQEAEVVVVGGTKVIAGGAITEGAVVGTTAAGLGAAKTVGTDTTHYILGTSLTEVASGEYATVVINCASAARAA
jgi:hypothetical protein